jgi:Endoglucanase
MQLNKGLNLGGWLSQCDHSERRYETFIVEKDIEYIASLGFDHIRLPIDYNVMEEDDGTIKEKGFALIDKAVNWARKYGLSIILDLHKAYGYDFNNAGNKKMNSLFTSEKLQSRFTGLWERIASRFVKYDNVAFELLNEVVEPDVANEWNDLIEKTVKAVRKIAPTKTIIYGGILWNSATTVKLLRKPLDKNIILTFHFYEPIIFTHQDAFWMPSIKNIGVVNYPDSMSYYKEKSKVMGIQGTNVTESPLSGDMGLPYLKSMMQEALDAAKKLDVKLYVGEFGVIDQAPAKDTVRWMKNVVSLFKEFGIGYALWTYKEMDFGLTQKHCDEMRDELVDVLTK